MNKRVKFLAVLLVLFLIIAVGHSIFHFYIWGTGLSGFHEEGSSVAIGGLVIGEEDVGEERTGEFSSRLEFSQMFVIGEWFLVFVFIILSYVAGRTSFKKEVDSIRIGRLKEISETATDIDRLYEILRKKKRARFSAIEKAFGVDEEVVKSWAETLELGGLASVDYPSVGEPELVFVEKNSSNK
jgi:hypothetical protein